MTTRVTVWNEFRHENINERVKAIYPNGIHDTIAGFLHTAGFAVRTATLDEPENGLPDDVIDSTDVMLWWAHMAHVDVSDAIVDKVQQRVLDGMGLIVLHSGHYSKIFKRLMGTSGNLKWREADEKERIWVIEPGHPIAEGLDQYFEIEHAEMYGEPFGIPAPDTLIFVSWFEGGDVFRSGCCWTRGNGRVFYFRPGHETYPIYHHPDVQRVIINAVRWAAPHTIINFPLVNVKEPLEPIKARD
jgi:trehalose utilization protein